MLLLHMQEIVPVAFCPLEGGGGPDILAPDLQWRSDKYDLNYANALPLMPTEFSSLFKRML